MPCRQTDGLWRDDGCRATDGGVLSAGRLPRTDQVRTPWRSHMAHVSQCCLMTLSGCCRGLARLFTVIFPSPEESLRDVGQSHPLQRPQLKGSALQGHSGSLGMVHPVVHTTSLEPQRPGRGPRAHSVAFLLQQLQVRSTGLGFLSTKWVFKGYGTHSPKAWLRVH